MRAVTLLATAISLFAIAPFGWVRPASATPLALSVDPLLTSLSLGVSSPLGAASTALDLSGTVAADVALASDPVLGLVATQITLGGASLTASHAVLEILAPGVSLAFSSSGLGAGFAGPPVAALPLAPGFSLGDFHDHVATLNAGTLAVQGSILAEPIDDGFDLGLVPIELLLPLNSIGQIVVVGSDPGSAEVSVSIPIDVVVQLFADELVFDVSLVGDLALQGMLIPEPGTGLLLGWGLLGMGAARRRTRTSGSQAGSARSRSSA